MSELATTTDVVAELIDRARERGYLLASEIDELRDPLAQAADPADEALEIATDLGLPIVEDVTEEATVPTVETPLTASRDPVRAYLDSAARTPLLDAEREMDLAKRYQAGLAAERMLRDGTKLTPKQRARLRQIERAGERSKEHMIKANLRLVVPQAKKWVGRDLEMIELIQEGNLGLIRAVEKFDHTKGYKFSTYATWWIRQALQRGVANKARTIRLPASVWELSAKIRKTETILRQKLGRDPTEDEVAEAVEVDPNRLKEVREALQRTGSLDLPVGEDGDTSLGDLLPDLQARDPERETSEADARLRIAQALGDLEEREREIVMWRFGFMDGQPHTLEEIGEMLDLSRERIRQVEKQALAKLRHPASARDLDPQMAA